MRRTAGLLAAVAALALSPAAGAGLKQEIRAANAVEKRLEAKHRAFRWTASCDHRTATEFDCTFVGRRGARLGRGTASATRTGRRYRARILTLKFKRVRR